MERDRRRSPRVWTTLWLALEGIDAEMRPHTGNLSATGIYFHSDRAVGEPGTVEWVVLSSADRAVSLEIMACVVRCVRVADRDEWGIGLEFMPESANATALFVSWWMSLTIPRIAAATVMTYMASARRVAFSRIRRSSCSPTISPPAVRSVHFSTSHPLVQVGH